MATTAATVISISGDYNLTDSADFETMTSGAGNGHTFSYRADRIVILKNDSGASRDYTVKMPTPGVYSAAGYTLADATVTVATGKSYVWRPAEVYASGGTITIECNGAGKLLILES
jgi:hypothetical protein